MHGCPSLVWSDELANIAQAWAEKMAQKGLRQYSENPSVGENICVLDAVKGHLPKGEAAVNQWYREIENYNYGKPGWKKGTHHFSQLLWKSTSEIGIGIAASSNKAKAFIVANYRPAGNNNMPGEFQRNVFPPRIKRRPVKRNVRIRDRANKA